MRTLPLVCLLTLGGWWLPTRPALAADAWRWPLPAPHEVVAGYDPPAHDWEPGHRGVDLAAHPGEPVRSAGAGLVRFAGRVGGVGVVSVLHPDGLLTTYEPLRSTVRRGQHVGAGQVLGRVTLRGSHCPPQACLHWGLRRDLDYLDPLALVGAGTVRLLPLGQPGGQTPLAPATAALTASGLAAGAVLVRRRSRPTSGREPTQNP